MRRQNSNKIGLASLLKCNFCWRSNLWLKALSLSIIVFGFVMLSTAGIMEQPLGRGPIRSLTDIRLFNRDGIKRQGLDPNSELRLKAAKQGGQKRIPFILAARSGRNAVVAALLRKLDGKIALRADDVDYIRGDIPTEEAERLAANQDVIDISLGEGGFPAPLPNQDEARSTPAAHYGPKDFLPVIDPKAPPTPRLLDDALKANKISQDPTTSSEPNAIEWQLSSLKAVPSGELTPINALLPTYQMGAPQFISQHPTFDGRGVTIAVIGAVGDLDHPMLSHARLLNGELIHKTVDILDVGTKSTTTQGSEWISIVPDLHKVNVGSNCTFTLDKKTYFAPRPGIYRVGILRSPDLIKTPGLSEGMGLAWDESRNLVWIDSHLDHDFRTVAPITDFGLWQQVVRIPGEDPGFTSSIAVKTYPREHILKFYPSTWHETNVASTAAGNGFMGSEATGVAPGAQILYVVSAGGSQQIEAEIEAYLFAARDPRVDVITSSWAPSIFTEGEDVASEILDRIVDRYNKVILRASGNYESILGSIYGMACPTKVFAIACYSTRASEEANWASPYLPKESEYVNFDGGSGPSGLGAIKPDLIAPSPSSRAMPCDYLHVARGEYAPQHCYFMGDGQSSMAAPMAAGAVALLISAAKQASIPYDYSRLRWALLSSARYLENWPIDRQGGGLVQVAKAWDQLKSVAAKPPVTILGAAKVSSAAVYNKTPGYGVGLYEIDWHPGQSGKRDIALYRTNGSSEPLRYCLSWIGNDSTFAAPSEVSLPLRTPYLVPVQITTREAGIHSALLRLSDCTTGEFINEVGMYVVSAFQLDPQSDSSVTYEGTLSRNRKGRVFIGIHPGATQVDIELHFDHDTGGLSIWRVGAAQVEEVKVSEKSGGRYSFIAPEPGVYQLMIFGPADALDSDNTYRKWQGLIDQQHYKVSLHIRTKNLTSSSMGKG